MKQGNLNPVNIFDRYFVRKVYKHTLQCFSELTADEFDVFYQNIKELSLYDTGIEAQYGDSLLTLSTCSYHTENGRLAVVAKRVYE